MYHAHQIVSAFSLILAVVRTLNLTTVIICIQVQGWKKQSCFPKMMTQNCKNIQSSIYSLHFATVKASNKWGPFSSPAQVCLEYKGEEYCLIRQRHLLSPPPTCRGHLFQGANTAICVVFIIIQTLTL